MKSKMGEIKYKVLYAQAVYGEEEKKAVMESLENPWLAAGPLVKRFEGQIAEVFGHQYGIATNSGSSANLLALECLDIPPDSEVVTPACTFSTVVSSILQNNLVPVFIDSVIGRYTIDENLIEQAITPKTKAILAPHLIGGVVDLKKLREIADTYHLYVIDDSCDTLGISLWGRPTGYYSDASTTSFYGSHIITAMGYGGMLCVSEKNRFKRATTFKDWGRVGGDGDDFTQRFNYSIDGIPYDQKFLYSEFGYNLKMNEGAAAFGLEQLKKLELFKAQRKRIFDHYQRYFLTFTGVEAQEADKVWFHPPHLTHGADTSWLAYPLTLTDDAPFDRYQLLHFLEKWGIQTRVLFSGNITRHPAYRQSPGSFRIASDLSNADKIMKDGFLIGCHQGMTIEDADYVIDVFEKFLRGYKSKKEQKEIQKKTIAEYGVKE